MNHQMCKSFQEICAFNSFHQHGAGRFAKFSVCTAVLLLVSSLALANTPCSSPDVSNIMVPEGFDCEVFATGLFVPTGLAVEDNGNLLVTQSGGDVSERRVLRFSPQGDLIAESNPIADPDGVAVDSEGQVFVAGGQQITIANSLDGGVDTVCRSGFVNLNNVAIDSQDRIVAVEDLDGSVWDVQCSQSTTLCVSLDSGGNALAFDDNDQLFAGQTENPGTIGRIEGCPNGTYTAISDNLARPARLAVGMGAPFGDEIFVSEIDADVVSAINETTGATTDFATGLLSPFGMAFDGTEAFYVAESGLGRIVRIFADDLKVGAYPNRTEFLDELNGKCTEGIDFEDIPTGTDITSSAMQGLEFQLLNLGCANYGDSTYRCGTQLSAPLTVIDSLTELPATGGTKLLSPGGEDILTCNEPQVENDDLALDFDNPVRAVGFDAIFKVLDGFSFLGIRILDQNNNILFEDDFIDIDVSALPGSQFFGYISDGDNIARVEIDEYDENCDQNFDEHVGYDEIIFTCSDVNEPPDADPNGPYSGTVGVPIALDGSGSSDPDGTIVAYDWDFGDGNTGAGVSPSHTYAAAGTYTVSLTVTDDAGATDTATTTSSIAAAAQDPIADPNGPYTGIADVPILFDGSGSNDPDGGSITAYDWDFGDGNTGAGVSPSHTYAATGAYTVTLTVVNDEGARSAPATTTATIEAREINCDINGNGRFDWRDAVRFAIGCRKGTATWACDLNDDGRFNWRDSVRYWKECSTVTR